MFEEKTIKNVLKETIEICESDPTKMKVTDSEGTRQATVQDYMELVRENLYELADMLGVEDVYLN